MDFWTDLVLRTIVLWKESFDKPRQHIKKQRRQIANKGQHKQKYDFSSIHVWMCELNHIEGWVPKNWCFQIVVLEKSFELQDQTNQF